MTHKSTNLSGFSEVLLFHEVTGAKDKKVLIFRLRYFMK